MSLPASILAVLESHKVNYNIANRQPPAANLQLVSPHHEPCLVKSVVLQDVQGRVQVLIPADRILDLDAVMRQYGRNFEGVQRIDIAPMIKQENLTHIPAIPKWQGMQTLVDASLFKRDKLWLESGAPDQILELNQQDFQEITRDSYKGDFTIVAGPVKEDARGDEADILNSVQKFTELRIRQRLDETLELPPLPETAQRIIKLRADPNADISDLAEIIELDPSLSAQVVSWAASPYYSAPGKIKSVHDAIVRVLGFDMVLNLALGLALGKTISSTVVTPHQINEYWRDAVFSAAAVEGLVTSISREYRPSFGMAYLSGLLNNFGWLILAEVFPPYFKNVQRFANANRHLPVEAVERHLLGVSGNQMASWLLDNWNMPEEVVVAVRQQNNINYAGEYHIYAKLIYVSKRMLNNTNTERPSSVLPQRVFDELHLDREAADLTVRNILESGEDLDCIAEKMR